jgi:hypothetical protein
MTDSEILKMLKEVCWESNKEAWGTKERFDYQWDRHNVVITEDEVIALAKRVIKNTLKEANEV